MKNLVKVLQIGMTSNIGGMETYLMEQFNHIDKNKVQYDFVNITGETDIVFKDKIEAAGSKVYNIQSRHTNPIKHYWQWCKLLRNVGKEYKAIVLNTCQLGYIFPIFAAKLFGIPMRIVHSHNAGNEIDVGLLRAVMIFINRVLMRVSATDYFACSKKAGQWMFKGRHDFLCIRNAIDSLPYRFDVNMRRQIRNKLGLTDELVIGHVGRFFYQKNHKKVIEVFSEVHKRHPNSVLLLVGEGVDSEGYIGEAKRQVEKYGIKEAVRFLGMRTDVPQLMQAMDAFLLPSHFEGLCLVGIEAQAACLPCFFSSKITREVAITELCQFIDLDADSGIWAQKILDGTGIERYDMTAAIAKAGYDIKTEIGKMEDYYMK